MALLPSSMIFCQSKMKRQLAALSGKQNDFRLEQGQGAVRKFKQ
jgi:hypothetical protein